MGEKKRKEEKEAHNHKGYKRTIKGQSQVYDMHVESIIDLANC